MGCNYSKGGTPNAIDRHREYEMSADIDEGCIVDDSFADESTIHIQNPQSTN